MDLAEEADLARLRGHVEEADDLVRQAFGYERQAAKAVESSSAPEPTRSVIHRSAASLALESGDFREAERLISVALSGEPPAEIAEELRDLLEQVHFQRHLATKGVSLEAGEFQFSIAGNGVGLGMAQSDELVDRLAGLRRLIFRTIDRLALRPFTDRLPEGRSKNFPIYVTMPRPASFAVTLKLGRPAQLPLEGMDWGSHVVDEVMTCVELLNSGEQGQLRDRIPDEAYFRNFVALAETIAPDGEDVSFVGLTTVASGKERTVSFTRPKSQIAQLARKEVPPADITPVTVRGELKYADARPTKTEREIILVDERGKQHRVVVPEGMMTDIVKPLWDDFVEVTGLRTGGKIKLQRIARVD